MPTLVSQSSHQIPKRFIFLGASGRIGQLLHAIWPQDMASNLHIDWQVRRAHDDTRSFMVWPDFKDPSPLVTHANRVGGLDGMFVFVGATDHGSGASHWNLNVSLVEQALHAAAAANIRRVIVASSSAVYGCGAAEPMNELTPLLPSTLYGRSKRDMELTCGPVARALGLEVCFLRIGNVAGADALLGQTRMRAKGAPVSLDIYPDGDGPRRSYIGPTSLATILCALALALEPLETTLNIGSPNSVSMRDLLNAADINWRPRPVLDVAQQDIVLDCARLDDLGLIAKKDGVPSQIIDQWHQAVGGI